MCAGKFVVHHMLVWEMENNGRVCWLDVMYIGGMVGMVASSIFQEWNCLVGEIGCTGLHDRECVFFCHPNTQPYVPWGHT